MGVYCIVVGEEAEWVGGLVWNRGGESTYSSSVRVVLPVMARARALAPSAPLLLL